jgi:hypothetical protein
MKLKLKKIRVNQLAVLLVAVIVALVLIRSLRKPEDYEGDVGPTGPSSEDVKKPEITEEDLKAALKFIA